SIPLAINGKYNSFSYIKINNREIERMISNIKELIGGVEVGIIQDEIPIYTTEHFDEQKEEYYLLQTNLVSSKIKVVMSFDGKSVFIPMKQFNNLFKLWIIISTAALGAFIIYIYNIINKPLKKLVEVMKQIEENNFDLDINYSTNDQFEYIFKGFKSMIDALKIYVEKTYEQELELNKSELRQLQSQINPHFLYNCFFNISKMCKIEDSENAMILSQKLAKYYMFITRNGSDSISLEEEYKHTKLYLDIQTIRFGERVNIQIDKIPEELKGIKVPRIILQPLVENCYKYVFEKISGQGELHIQIEGNVGRYLKISIEDNGNIISNQEIEALNISLTSNEKKKETTGLFNVNKRLRLKFGETSGLNVARGKLGGLKIQLFIELEGSTVCIDCL
ncbi:sensor histidine kinase, partial [Clostridium sp.]|uniref:sensor histidine kinase n=1 Tax=Clostridium sp. TaxID=1506 RepID=UPI003F3E6035